MTSRRTRPDRGTRDQLGNLAEEWLLDWMREEHPDFYLVGGSHAGNVMPGIDLQYESDEYGPRLFQVKSDMGSGDEYRCSVSSGHQFLDKTRDVYPEACVFVVIKFLHHAAYFFDRAAIVRVVRAASVKISGGRDNLITLNVDEARHQYAVPRRVCEAAVMAARESARPPLPDEDPDLFQLFPKGRK